jgi:lipoic acid synthetase
MTQPVTITPRPRLPEWARRPHSNWDALHVIKTQLREHRLNTVCESARCPNIHECFARGSATFMILGNECTRSCGFCSVPRGRGEPLDPAEPENVARMAAGLNLRYVVITSVNRDEMADGGAGHWAATVRALRAALPQVRVEVLTPDFRGVVAALETVLEAGPHVFNHNMETVPRLYRHVRPQADYRQSLEVLTRAKRHSPQVLTKSGLMLGLGEDRAEVEQLLRDLREAPCDVVTIGQYLQPTRRNLPVVRYVDPAEFEHYRDFGMALGFRNVFSGPLVRSSYMADAAFESARQQGEPNEDSRL